MCADAFNKFLPFCTGFAAGCMIWMVIAEVLPDAFKVTLCDPDERRKSQEIKRGFCFGGAVSGGMLEWFFFLIVELDLHLIWVVFDFNRWRSLSNFHSINLLKYVSLLLLKRKYRKSFIPC